MNMAAYREVLIQHFPNIDHEISDYVSSKTVFVFNRLFVRCKYTSAG